jgi:hypothetical protein
LHAKPSRSFADRDPMRRCGDCPYAERKCGKQIRRHVERCVSDKIRTVSARLPRRSTSGQRDHSGCQHRRFPLWSRFAQWLGESHRVHGRELRRRIGTSFGQFRQRNLARSHGKRELRWRLDCAATIIAPANVRASAPGFLQGFALAVNRRPLLVPGLGLLDLCRKLEQQVLVAEAAYKLHANRQTRLRPGERPQKSISQETETRVAETRFECVATSTSGRPLAQPCINPTHNRSLRLWCRPAQAKSESPPSSSSPRPRV